MYVTLINYVFKKCQFLLWGQCGQHFNKEVEGLVFKSLKFLRCKAHSQSSHSEPLTVALSSKHLGVWCAVNIIV